MPLHRTRCGLVCDEAGPAQAERELRALPAGAAVAIGTDWSLVDRSRPNLHMECLDEDICPCVTMNRVTLPAIVDTLEALVASDESRLHVVRVSETMVCS